jgi:hypothetical protein
MEKSRFIAFALNPVIVILMVAGMALTKHGHDRKPLYPIWHDVFILSDIDKITRLILTVNALVWYPVFAFPLGGG